MDCRNSVFKFKRCVLFLLLCTLVCGRPSGTQIYAKKKVNSSNVAPQTGDQGSFLIKLSMAVLAIGIIFVTIGLFSVEKSK